ncbi:o-succinylbenzoate--CoA ligase [Delftia sp. Cs1-4]|uniref:class I adenylate-forming enzyme family protein n=1 Tax=Delftia sp. (strain Cs1-4) TaxID=742013 RepID=UPI00020E797D|nr:class I adenylate-forming enzyme family protein [Delftia sp. Cs1-4]AEF88677.1 o-succinylbenzoate--CoA ligase [Delftia sp. Cs1-4]
MQTQKNLPNPFRNATLAGALSAASQKWPDSAAYVIGDERLTFREAAESMSRVARGFMAAGIKKGDRVAIWMAGYREWLESFLGLAAIGAIAVPVSTRFSVPELAHALARAEARGIVYHTEVVGSKDYESRLVEALSDRSRSAAGKPLGDSLNLRISVGKSELPNAITFAEMIERGAAISDDAYAAALASVTSEDPLILLFTSGTTSLPKAAVSLHGGQLGGSAAFFERLNLRHGDRFFCPQPFFHGGGVLGLYSPIVSGATVVFQTYYDVDAALEVMVREKCNVTMGHQPHYIEYFSRPDYQRAFAAVDRAWVIAPKHIMKLVHEKTGIASVFSPYGATEANGTSCAFDDPMEARLNTVGSALPGVTVGILDASGDGKITHAYPTGEGEVCLKSPYMMRGYWNDPEATAAVIDKDGWYHTGDLGRVDEHGRLHLLGRVRETIRVGGENVTSAEIEAALLHCKGVKQSVAVGAPDERLGEIIVAFVEAQEGVKLDAESLREELKPKLARFKIPHCLVFQKEWPMTGSGKIARKELEAAAAVVAAERQSAVTS